MPDGWAFLDDNIEFIYDDGDDDYAPYNIVCEEWGGGWCVCYPEEAGWEQDKVKGFIDEESEVPHIIFSGVKYHCVGYNSSTSIITCTKSGGHEDKYEMTWTKL